MNEDKRRSLKGTPSDVAWKKKLPRLQEGIIEAAGIQRLMRDNAIQHITLMRDTAIMCDNT